MNTTQDKVRMKIGIFTVHKAASMLYHKLTIKCVERSGLKLKYYTPNTTSQKGFMCPFTDPKENFSATSLEEYEKVQHGVIGPIRRPLRIVPDHCILLLLRDPRDGLVSMFYSFSKIHGGIPDERRNFIINKGIDRFVLDAAPDYCVRYEYYLNKIAAQPKTMLLRYEDMFDHPDEWINGFCTPFQLERSAYAEVKEYFRRETDIKTARMGTHKNRMIPGQYLTDLKSDTVGKLNKSFSWILLHLGYQ